MTQDNQKARDHQKHISMELTADEARVTNLSLRGNRLVLTIEAELSDSQLRASDAEVEQPPAAGRPERKTEVRQRVLADVQTTERPPQSADAPVIGLAAPLDAAPGVLAMGSETLPPALSAAFEPQPKSMVIDPHDISSPVEPAIGLALAPEPIGPAPLPPAPPAPEPPPLPPPLPLPPMPAGDTRSSSTTFEVKSDPHETERQREEARQKEKEAARSHSPGTSVAISLDPVRGWADTREVERELPRALDPDATVPLGLEIPLAPPTPPAPAPAVESVKEIRLGGDDAGIGAAPPAFAPVPPPPAAPVAPSPIPSPAPELRLGGDLSSPAHWDGHASAVALPQTPAVETWDRNVLRLDDAQAAPVAPGEPLALSEDSSAVGGDRHGEPLPAISFGSDAPPPFAAAPAPHVAVPPETVQPTLEPMPPPVAAPMSPAGFDDGMAVGPVVLMDPRPQSSFMSPDDVPTQMAMQPQPAPAPEAKSEAKPEPKQEPKGEAPMPEPPKPDAPQSDDKQEAGGTTVLIRYTCPKCKTQGMQAVDKVGTVVNCSNCGKAMRLVMKK